MQELEKQLQRYDNLYQELIRIYVDWAKAHDVSVNEVMILASLYAKRDGCTQKQISDEWVLPKQTVNTIVCNLRKSGYVESTLSTSDSRQKPIRLTQRGIEYAKRFVPRLREIETSSFENMGFEGRKQFLDLLEQFTTYFRQYSDTKDLSTKKASY